MSPSSITMLNVQSSIRSCIICHGNRSNFVFIPFGSLGLTFFLCFRGDKDKEAMKREADDAKMAMDSLAKDKVNKTYDLVMDTLLVQGITGVLNI